MATHSTTTSSISSSSSTHHHEFEVTSHSSPYKFFHPTHATLKVKKTGETYLWNSRAHRKMRLPLHQDQTKHHRHFPRLWVWEPHIITWHINIVNIIANTLWVINGVFGTWPDTTARSEDVASEVAYATGVVGAFLFIVAGYLGYVEAVNHTHANVVIPGVIDSKTRHDTTAGGSTSSSGDGDTDKAREEWRKVRAFIRTTPLYGYYRSPIGHDHPTLHADKCKAELLRMGFPYLEDAKGRLISTDYFDLAISMFEKQLQVEQVDVSKKTVINDGDEEEGAISVKKDAGGDDDDDENNKTQQQQYAPLIGTEINIRSGHHVCKTNVSQVRQETDKKTLMEGLLHPDSQKHAYEWWTWHPDFHHIGVFNAFIFFVSTIIFFIPAVLWWPMDNADRASMGTFVFFQDVLQVIPSLGFVYTGHASMAEASGSWWKPKANYIGYWAAFFNTLGSYGFLICGALAIPVTLGSECCPDIGKWGSEMSTFWGSCAFWVAGILQWIEFANPEPMTLVTSK